MCIFEEVFKMLSTILIALKSFISNVNISAVNDNKVLKHLNVYLHI